MSTPRCISLVTICACDVPEEFSFTTNSITCSSVIDDWAMAHTGNITANTTIMRYLFIDIYFQ